MSEILRDYTIDFNLETGNISKDYISFFITDKNVSTLFVKLQANNDDGILAYLKNSEVSNHSLKLSVKKPKSGEKVEKTGRKITGQNDDVATFRFDLETKFTNQDGECICELFDTFLENGLEKVASSKSFPYTVNKSNTTDATTETPGQPSTAEEVIITLLDGETGAERDIKVSSDGTTNEIEIEGSEA